MRLLMFTIFLFTTSGIVLSQSDYSQQLEKAALSIADKIRATGKQNVAVLDFENSNKQVSELGSWLSGVFTTLLENNSSGAFSVKNNTDVAKAIQQIKTESGSGAFDTRSIQRLGEISGSDVVIYATITLMDDQLTINIKAVNPSAQSQKPIGGILVSFSATEGMRTKYDNYIENMAASSSSPASKTSSASGEGTAKMSKNPNCKEANTGDICFQNNTNKELKLSGRAYGNSRTYTCTLQPGQKQCFYNINVGPMKYNLVAAQGNLFQYDKPAPGNYEANGSIYIEQCKEVSFIIR